MAGSKCFLSRLALWSFVLNAIWETALCPFFYDMRMPTLAAMGRMLSAFVGDVIAAFVLVVITGLLTRQRTPGAMPGKV